MALGAADAVCAAFWLVGFMLEAAADNQKCAPGGRGRQTGNAYQVLWVCGVQAIDGVLGGVQSILGGNALNASQDTTVNAMTTKIGHNDVDARAARFVFRSKPENKSRYITSGVWRYSRHPNYCGEITMWTAMAVCATACAVQPHRQRPGQKSAMEGRRKVCQTPHSVKRAG